MHVHVPIVRRRFSLALGLIAPVIGAVVCVGCATEVVIGLPPAESVELPPGDDDVPPAPPIDGDDNDGDDDNGSVTVPPEPPPDDDPPDDDPPDDDPVDPPVIPENPACANGPLDEPINGCAPDPLPSTGDPHEDCVIRINQLRYTCQCLPPLQRWTDGEECADRMAQADHNSGNAHGGFSSGMCDGGFAQNECPGWGSVDECVEGCLQMMWDEGPGSFWGGSGHYINMTTDDHSHVACGFFDGGNGAWSVQNFF